LYRRFSRASAGKDFSMSEDEQRSEAAEELASEPAPGEPWAKTSSGDADDVVDDDA
jgi:hypothetical protein